MQSPDWNIQELTPEQKQLCHSLANELNISTLAAQLLVDRGLHTAAEARAYIRPDLASLHDPFAMRDMAQAVERLQRAIGGHERIMVYGDYDVDGTTAVALMYSFLRTQTDNLTFYIPDRYAEGYGISFKGIDTAEAEGCTLIVALDCGIKAVDKVQYAREKGIDFIICDHHTPGLELPAAVAVLNMKRADCGYPYKELSGCGVGFKLVQAYALRAGIPLEQIYPLLALVAMSIASDIVPVTGENRILVYFGLRQINHAPLVGVQAIMDAAKISRDHTVTIHDLMYKVGPRINACGRLKSGAEAVRLLITEDADFAKKQAAAVESHNEDRKKLDTQTTNEALRMLQDDPHNAQKYTTVVYAPGWHKGVIGIAASRLIESYYRPTIVLTAGDNGLISGSARSVADFDIYSAIDSCRDLLTNFGGHMFAAGLSMKQENLPAFQQRFEAYVASHITPEQQKPIVRVEAEVCLSDITDRLWNVLRHLEPFGPGNPRPVFLTRGLVNGGGTRAVGKEADHLRLEVTDHTTPRPITGIAFRQGDKAPHLQSGKSVDICYQIEENTFNHQTTRQMMVVDMHLNNE